MDRINGADTIDIGGDKRGFRDENVVGGLIGTEVTAAHMNAVQEEIMKVIEAAGLDPEVGDWTQLWQALQILTTVELPWSSDEESADPTTDDRIIEVYQVHDLLKDQDLSKSAPIVLLHETRIGNASPYSLADDFSDKRKFNTVVTDQIGVTLVDFQIGLPAGVYRVEAIANGFDAGHHRARLYDVTNDAVLLLGTSCDSYPGVVTPSMMVGHIVLPAATLIELQHKSEPSGTRLSGDDNNILPDAHMDSYILITREKSL